jgi:hypothetical protein
MIIFYEVCAGSELLELGQMRKLAYITRIFWQGIAAVESIH